MNSNSGPAPARQPERIGLPEPDREVPNVDQNDLSVGADSVVSAEDTGPNAPGCASFENFAERRTGEEIVALLGYGHPIPVGRGWTRQYVEEHFPGWTWNSLMEVWREALPGARINAMRETADRIEMIHFSGPTSWVIE